MMFPVSTYSSVRSSQLLHTGWIGVATDRDIMMLAADHSVTFRFTHRRFREAMLVEAKAEPWKSPFVLVYYVAVRTFGGAFWKG